MDNTTKKLRLVNYKGKLGVVLDGYFIDLETLERWLKKKWIEYYKSAGIDINFIEDGSFEEMEKSITLKTEDREETILWLDYEEIENEEFDEMVPMVYFRLPPKE
jgi:hypothetical protein